MRLAIIADIHGNLDALRAVLADAQAQGAEQIVVNGDVVNRGFVILVIIALYGCGTPAARTCPPTGSAIPSGGPPTGAPRNWTGPGCCTRPPTGP